MGRVRSGIQIIPSIASADPLNLMGEIERLDGIPNLHLDIEDGNFVPNITFGMKTVRRIAEYVNTKKELDAHLFIVKPNGWIQNLAECGVKRVAVQMEALSYPLETLHTIHQYGMKAGLGLNFSTPAEAVLPFLPQLDYIIVMTAEPDGMGMQFRPVMLEKIRKLSQYLGNDQEIWADGGIDSTTIYSVAEAGVSTIILGRAVFSADNPLHVIRNMTETCVKSD